MARIALTLTLLGGFEARLASGEPLPLRRKKTQALLAYLAIHPGQAHSRDKLAALLWGETGEDHARSSLRQAVFALREVLPATRPPILLTDGGTVALNAAAVDVDVAAFERLLAEGTPDALVRAAAIYRGDLLDGFHVKELGFEEWLTRERERLRQRVEDALARLLATQERSGAAEEAIQTALRLLAIDPVQEPVHRTLMRLYARQGRWGPALRQYQLCVGVLQRELGVEPEAETRQLYQELLQKRSPRPAAAGRPGSLEVPTGGRTPRPRRRATRTAAEAAGLGGALIGREAELARLRAGLEAAWSGHGQVVTVIGEAGIGKTRLIEELGTEAAGRHGLVLVGRSYESEQVLPFGPWADAFRSGGVLKDPAALDGFPVGWRVELTRLFPELAEPGFQALTDAADHLRLFEAVAQLVAHLAARRSLLLVLEDLHWADEMSCRLLAFVTRRVRASRILLVGTAREEELAESPALRHTFQELKREQRLVEVHLPALSPADTLALVRTLANPGTDESAVQRLAEQAWRVSEGNPFMVVESMRALREGAAPDATAGALPEEIRDVIAARLERLSERGRQLAAVAAVVGREFDFALVQRASEFGERDAAEGIEELVRRHVFRAMGDRFDFAHERIRDVALRQLLPLRRKLLHRRVAEAMEALRADELEPYWAALGTHYYEAEVWSQALTYLHRAGIQAAARSAHREAVALLDQALRALRNLPSTREHTAQAIDLHLALRNSLLPRGDHARIAESLGEAERLAAGLGDQRRLGRVFAYWTRSFWEDGDHRRAVELGRQAEGIATGVGDFGLQITATFYLGVAYHSLGEYPRAIECHRRIVTSLTGELTAERFGLPAHPSVFSRTWLVWALIERGEFTEAMAYADEAVHLADGLDRRWDRIVANFGVGLFRLLQGDLDAAITVLERSCELCPAEEFPRWFAVIAGHLGAAYALAGRIAEGLPLLERAAAFERSGHRARLLSYLGEAYLGAGRLAEAAGVGRQALAVSRQRTERGIEGWILRLLGEIASRRDPPDIATAQAQLGQALALSDELGMRPLRAHCQLGLGRLCRRAGDSRRALTYAGWASALFGEMHMDFWATRAEEEVGVA
jgi:DNA-binding SARP family transcriptional activator